MDNKMGQISELFFENPTKDFHIRGIARQLNIPKTTASYHIHSLLEKNIIVKQEEGVFPSFRANETSEKYRFYKKQEFMKTLVESGLLDYVEEQTRPKCIILFGSFAKAEYDEKSDIDLFVQANDAKLDLSKFERKLKHKINVLFGENLNKLSKDLLNNIINGIKLQGYIKLR
ncbi:MAG: nucleotidyltransferase domain-containing protein [archaeon]